MQNLPLMENNPLRVLLRVFFQYQTSVLLYLENHYIAGVVEKKTAEEIMSDLSDVRQTSSIPFKKMTNEEELLNLFYRYAIEKDHQKVMPVVDQSAHFVGLWNKSEILQSLPQPAKAGKVSVPNVSVSGVSGPGISFTEKPEKQAGVAFAESPVEVPVEVKETEKKPRPEVQVKVNPDPLSQDHRNNDRSADSLKPDAKSASSAESSRADSKRADQKNISAAGLEQTENPPEDENEEYIIVKTLEALPIPMLAVNTKGEVLFYNQDWVNLQKKNKNHLGVKNIMNITRDLMAKMAFDGSLEIDSVLSIPNPPQGYRISMRSILSEPVKISQVMGYVFWAEQEPEFIVPENAPQNTLENTIGSNRESNREKDNGSVQSTSHEAVSEAALESVQDINGEKSYSGKTLIDLLQEEEKKIMAWAMQETGGNQTNAAMLLGIPRQTFSYRYHKLFDSKMTKK